MMFIYKRIQYFLFGTLLFLSAQVFAFESQILHSLQNNKDIEVSVLTTEEAQYYFDLMANDAEIPFYFPKDGCFVRAHMMAHRLESFGILTAKSFVTGRILVPTANGPESWRYHVAPLVLVQNGDQIEPTIFDPSLFNKPVSQNEFVKLLSRSRMSRIIGQFYTNRFAISPEQANDDYVDYVDSNEAAINDMLIKLRTMAGH